jgi:hypothetical protein
MFQPKSPWLAAIAVGVAMGSQMFARSAMAVPISYTANLSTSNGQPITNIMILETDGAQTHLDYPFSLPASGISVLTHDVPFAPTKSLVIGLTEGAEKTQVVMLLDSNFAQNHSGQPFSSVFPNTRHSEMITRLTAAEAGDSNELAWFTNTFLPGDGAAAAFNTGGSFSVAEFSTLDVIGAGTTAGNWIVTNVQNIPEGGLGSEGGHATTIIDETATDTGPFDIGFQLTPPGFGLVAILKNVLNDSGTTWTAFEMQLGAGLGDQFVISPPGDNLLFDAASAHAETSGAFPNLIYDEDRLLFSGFLADGDTANFVVFVNANEGNSFSIRQLVPEPSSFTLAALALVVVCRRRCRAERY